MATSLAGQPKKTDAEHVLITIWELMDAARKQFCITNPHDFYDSTEPLVEHPAPFVHCDYNGRPNHEGLAYLAAHAMNSMTQAGVAVGAFRGLNEQIQMPLYRCPGTPR